MRKEPLTITEADINPLDQFSTLLARKLSNLFSLNEQLQHNLSELKTLDNDIVGSNNFDDN